MEETVNENSTIITISDVLEYQFCPRFIYFMHCLDIPQHEEKRFKVLKGREVHEERKLTNKEYVRKKLHCVQKESEVYLVSKTHHIKGIVDKCFFWKMAQQHLWNTSLPSTRKNSLLLTSIKWSYRDS